MWHRRSLLGRAWLLARFAPWPIVVLATTAYFTWLNGAVVRRRSGRGVAAQICDQLVMAGRHGILPPWYYMFELFRAENRARTADYLHRYETKGALYGLLKRNVEKVFGRELLNKAIYARICAEQGVPTPPLVTVIEDGRIGRRWSTDGVEEEEILLPAADLFIKPMLGKGGRGTLRAEYIGDDSYRTPDGITRSSEELVAYLRSLSRSRPLVVQRRLFNHPDIADLCANALSCARILTVKRPDGSFEAVHAAFRMALHADSPVDGLHMGGVVSRIDIESGRLGPATDLGFRAARGWSDVHPSTGVPIAGRVLPLWPEARALAERAHAAFGYKTAVGWDIAITAEGPVALEGNSSPCVDIMQRVEGPIGATRFGESFAFHVERAERLALGAGEPPGGAGRTSDHRTGIPA